MSPLIPRTLEVQGPELFLGKISWKPAESRAMARKSGPWKNDVPARLVALRLAVSGESQTRFAAQIGLEVKRWNNFERGSPLSKEAAIQLVQRIPGLTLDWLFLGKEDGLPVKLQRELAEVGKATIAEGKRG
jgi:hypothetical protein